MDMTLVLWPIAFCIGIGFGYWLRDQRPEKKTPSHRAAERPSKAVEVTVDTEYQPAPRTRPVAMPVSVVKVPESDADPSTVVMSVVDPLEVYMNPHMEAVLATYKPPAPGRHAAVVHTDTIKVIPSDTIVIGTPTTPTPQQPKRGRHAA